MTRKMTKTRGGMIPAAALAGIVGRAAVGWAVPKVLNYMTKKRGKKSGGAVNPHGSRGGAVNPHGSRGGALNLLGSKPNTGRRRRGGAVNPHGAKPGHGIKQIAQKALQNPLVQGMVAKAKQQAKRHINYAIDNPQQAFKNVQKMVRGGKGYKTMRSLNVRKRKFPKQKVGIESNQAGGTTSITISKHFKPNMAVKAPLSMRQIKNKI